VGDAVGDTVAAELQSLRSLAVMLHHSKRAKRNPCEPVCRTWQTNKHHRRSSMRVYPSTAKHVRHMRHVLMHVCMCCMPTVVHVFFMHVPSRFLCYAHTMGDGTQTNACSVYLQCRTCK
jgi:hypothetical protein